ncbi:hypothetical protein SAY86_025550 [Trapa natans]|uniref:Uncharacterized protein n=1 Tax=Trapa natans TaxID=22666 RepID=A0AAN7MR62_TRANT|nr:hypothetical protein SAY86_025550 [Trapa natans]
MLGTLLPLLTQVDDCGLFIFQNDIFLIKENPTNSMIHFSSPKLFSCIPNHYLHQILSAKHLAVGSSSSIIIAMICCLIVTEQGLIMGNFQVIVYLIFWGKETGILDGQ